MKKELVKVEAFFNGCIWHWRVSSRLNHLDWATGGNGWATKSQALRNARDLINEIRGKKVARKCRLCDHKFYKGKAIYCRKCLSFANRAEENLKEFNARRKNRRAKSEGC